VNGESQAPAATKPIRSSVPIARSRAVVWLGLWAVLMLGAIGIDRPVAAWVYHSEIFVTVRRLGVTPVIRAPGTFYFTLAAAAAMVLWDRRTVRASAALLLSGLMAGVFYTIAKWSIGRHRPIFDGRTFNPAPFELHFFHGGLTSLIRPGPNLSFPSGHECLAFATAAALTTMIPSWGWAFYAVAVGVGVERVLEGAHYVSDVVAAAGLGILAWKATAALMARFFGWELSGPQTR